MINILSGLLSRPLFNFLCLSGWGRDEYYLVENKTSIPAKGGGWLGGNLWQKGNTLLMLIGREAN